MWKKTPQKPRIRADSHLNRKRFLTFCTKWLALLRCTWCQDTALRTEVPRWEDREGGDLATSRSSSHSSSPVIDGYHPDNALNLFVCHTKSKSFLGCSPPDIVFKYYSMMTKDDWCCLTDHEYEKGNFEQWPAWCMNSGINLRTIYQKPVPQKEDTQGASISTKYDWHLNKCHIYYIF